MMLLAPVPIAAVSAGADELLTPSPRELWLSGATEASVEVDLGRPRFVDCAFLGFHAVAGAGAFRVDALVGGAWVELGSTPWLDPVEGFPNHALVRWPGRIAQRLRCRFSCADAYRIGAAVLMIGWRFLHPHELGGGRGIAGGGTRELLPDGGVAGEEGVARRTLAWRFAGLVADQVDALELIALGRGPRAPLVAFEHRTLTPMTEDYPTRRMIFGVLDRFEPFERLHARDHRWSFSMIEVR